MRAFSMRLGLLALLSLAISGCGVTVAAERPTPKFAVRHKIPQTYVQVVEGIPDRPVCAATFGRDVGLCVEGLRPALEAGLGQTLDAFMIHATGEAQIKASFALIQLVESHGDYTDRILSMQWQLMLRDARDRNLMTLAETTTVPKRYRPNDAAEAKAIVADLLQAIMERIASELNRFRMPDETGERESVQQEGGKAGS